jgi:hypothetical protein
MIFRTSLARQVACSCLSLTAACSTTARGLDGSPTSDAAVDRSILDAHEFEFDAIDDEVSPPFVRDVARHDTVTPDVARVAVPDRAPATIEEFARDELITIVPDLDGDGRADIVRSSRTRTVIQLGWPARVTTPVAFVRVGTDLVASVGDLDDDGRPDLALSSTWNHEVHVYFGPFDGTAQPLSAAFRVSRDPMGGLADLFGSTTLIDDFTGDGRADLLVAAPSEQEEACTGTGATLVYRGPLSPGARDARDSAADFALAGNPGECLGEHVEVRNEGGRRVLLLSLARPPRVRGYALPLARGQAPLDPGSTPSLSPPLSPDVDADGVADRYEVDPMSSRLVFRRSSDGRMVDPRWLGEPMQARLLDMNGDGLGVPWMVLDRFDSATRRWTTHWVRVPTDATGVVELSEATPRATTTRDAEVGTQESRGDLDGDGVHEIAWGNVLVRHARE